MTIFAILLGLAATPEPTTEVIRASGAEIQGPCHLSVSGKPSGEPPQSCANAIATASTARQQAIFYFAWAYSLNEVGAGKEALPWLDRAIELAPNFTNALHERAFTLGDLGFFRKALVDADKDVELSPENADAYVERSFSRHRLADFEGSLSDLRKAAELGNLHVLDITSDLMWLGRYDEANRFLSVNRPAETNAGFAELRDELDRRLAYRPDGKEHDRCRLDQSTGDRQTAQRIVSSCTWMFDRERDPLKKAELLTTRAAFASVARQDRKSGVADFQIAVALDPLNPDRHINYGYALVGINHSWAGRNALDDALSMNGLKPTSKALGLAGRAQANFNMGDLALEKLDAKASFEIEPSLANAQIIGDIFAAEGNKEAAKQAWMAAYHMGSRDDSLISSLKSVGVNDPEKEPK